MPKKLNKQKSKPLIKLKIKSCIPGFICLLVAAIHWLFLPQKRFQLGGIDAYLYTSLSLDYAEMLGRFGPTYYATRLAVIAPMGVFYRIFGLEYGFILLRVIYSAFAGYFLFLILAQKEPQKPSLVLSGVLIISPWLTRELAWDYVTGFSVVYLLGGIAFLLQPKGWKFSIGSGVLCAFAINSNFSAIPWCASFMCCWLAVNILNKEKNTFKKLSLFCFGVLFFYLPVSLIMWIKFPVFGAFFEWKSIETTIWLMKGAAQAYFTPLKEYFYNGFYYISLPFIVALCLGWSFYIKKLRISNHQTLLFMTYLLVSCFIVLYFHFIAKTAVFIHFSIIYLMPATYFGVSKILEANKFFKTEWSNLQAAVLFSIIFLVLHFGLRLFAKVPLSAIVETPALVTFFLIGLILLFKKQNPFSYGLFLAGLTLLPLSSKNHKILCGGSQQNETMAIQIGKKALKIIQTYAPYKNGPMRLWVPIPESPVIRCITALNFWGYSIISLKEGKGLPEVQGELSVNYLDSSKYLILISDVGRSLIEKGLQNILESTGESWVPKYEGQLEQDFTTVDIVVAEKNLKAHKNQKKISQAAQDLSIRKTTACFQGQGTFREGRFVFRTDPRLWANSANLAITEKLPTKKPALIVRISVKSGLVQLYVLGDQEKRTMPASYIISSGAEQEIIVNILPEHTINPRLVISNANPNSASQGELISVRLIQTP